MPLWPEYREQIKAPLGDFKNIGGNPAGSITAAWFLANFVGDVPWAHLDIAGTAWTEGSWATMPPYLQRDVATGVGVRLLTHFAKAGLRAWIVIPTYNEAGNIERMVQTLRELQLPAVPAA